MSVTAEPTKSDVLMRELWHVAGTGDVGRLEEVLAQGVDINASDRTGVTALMRAAYHGELPMVRALIEGGADLDTKDTGGLTALMMAKHSGHAEIVDALLSSGAKESAKRRVHKSLPVEAELAETAPFESAPEETAGAVTRENPKTRTLHEPPEIWELVHTTQADSAPETVRAREFPLAGKLPSARTLILAASVLIVVGAAFGYLSLRGSGSANDATARHSSSVSEQQKVSKAPASSTTQPLTQSIQNGTSAEPAKAGVKSNQTASLKPAGEVGSVPTAQNRTPQSAEVALPVKKTSAKLSEQTAGSSRADVDMRVLRAGRYESLQKPPARARGSNSDKSASASTKSEAIKTPSPQVTAPSKTNAPKPKVIQWP